MSLSKVAPSNAAQEQKPPILTLDDDSLDEIFDYLQLRDICAIGLTCKHLQQVSGTYFSRNYPLKSVQLEHNRQTVDRIDTNFAPYAHQIEISTSESLRYAATMTYRNLDGLAFVECEEFNANSIQHLMEMKDLKNITTLRFSCYTAIFYNNILNGILKLCNNLKCLIFQLDYDDESERGDDTWMSWTIPKLEHLRVFSVWGYSGLQRVIKANPHMKRLSVEDGDFMLRALSDVDFDIELDELELVSIFPIDELTRNQLIALNKQGRFKDLRIFCHYALKNAPDYLKDFTFLTSLKIPNVISHGGFINFTQYLASNTTVLSNLRKLNITHSHMRIEDTDTVPQLLPSLEELHLPLNSLEYALPFARQLPKLRMIVATAKSSKHTSLNALNNDRMKLPGVEKLTIYLHDEAFEQIRWTSLELFYEFVEVRRVVYPNKGKRRRLN